MGEMMTNIDDPNLVMSIRLSMCLSKLDIKTLEEANKISCKEWKNLGGAGNKSWHELQEILVKWKASEFDKRCIQNRDIFNYRPRSLEKLLGTLEKNEEFVMIHRYGLFGERYKTQKEVAQLLKLTPNKIKLLRLSAIRKLKECPKGFLFSYLYRPLVRDIFGRMYVYDILEKICPDTEKLHENTLDSIKDEIMKSSRNSEKYIKDLSENYKEFVEVLKGSELMKFLGHIDRMASQLNSQHTNLQSSLQIMQKLLVETAKSPSAETKKIMNTLSEQMFRIEEITNALQETLTNNVGT